MKTRPKTGCLVLPGMTLNSTIFPDLGCDTVSADFSELVVSSQGDIPAEHSHPMEPYAQQLDHILTYDAAWRRTSECG